MGDGIDRIKLNNQVSKGVGMTAVNEYCGYILAIMAHHEFTIADLRMLQMRFSEIATMIDGTISTLQDELGGNGDISP